MEHSMGGGVEGGGEGGGGSGDGGGGGGGGKGDGDGGGGGGKGEGGGGGGGKGEGVGGEGAHVADVMVPPELQTCVPVPARAHMHGWLGCDGAWWRGSL